MADESKRPVRKVKIGPFRIPGLTTKEASSDSRSVLARRVKQQLRGVVRQALPDPDEEVRIVPRRPAGEPPHRSFLPPDLDDDDE